MKDTRQLTGIASRLGLVVLGAGLCLWAQGARGRGNGRGTQAPAAAPAPEVPAPAPAPAGRGGRGGAAANGPNDLYDFSAAAGDEAALRDTGPVETQQQVTINGQAMSYTARAGYIAINNATSGTTEAHIFYTYYARSGGAGERPLVFLFGGAPGAAASWLELGGLGPKRLELGADGSAGLPPYKWSDNPQTLLADGDLVFVNPVGTGFSRAESPSLNAKFATPLYDAASLGEFVRSFLGEYDRWNSPRILVGEDYGTGRVANLASYLAAHQLPVNAVAILSVAQTGDATAGDEQYMTLLPSEVMASWYHKELAPELESLPAAQVAERARQFASREYLHALYKGDRMTAAERSQVLADMARLTGLSQAFLANNDLRVTTARYDAELLRSAHESVDDSDSRDTGYLRPGGGGRGGRGGFGAPAAAADPHQEGMASGFLSAYEAYLRHDLNFTNHGVYYLSEGGTSPWSGAVSDDTSLASAFDRDPGLQVFVGLDYYDMSSPFYATEFTLAHLQAPAAAIAHNLTTGYFAAGAMAYTDPAALAQLHGDLSQLIHKSGGAR